MFKSGYFISIGAGKNQLPLILKSKELGLKVIAVDNNRDAVGFRYSDIKIIQSVQDFRKIYATILKLYLDEPIVGVGVRSYGKAVLTASYIAEKFQLIGNNFTVLKKFYNKKLMKAFLGENGISVPTSYTWKNLKEFPKLVSEVSYPCILKPVDNIAKLGIEVFQNEQALLSRLTQLKPKNDRFLLEEFIEGDEVTVLGFVQNRKFTLVSISDKITTKFPPFLELSHRLPTVHEKIKGELRLLCQNIAQLTGLENSPIVAEFKVTTRGQIYLIEIMPEIGGEYLADYLIPEFYEYDYFKNYVNLLTGNPIRQIDNRKLKKKLIQSQICFITPPEGISMFTAIVKSEFDSDKKVFLEQNLKEIGTQVNTKDGNACRVQVIGITSSNQIKPEELDKNIRNVYNAKFE
jgi:biotin carboxylase